MILDCPRCGVKHVQSQQVQIADDRNGDPSQRWHVERCQNPACSRLILAIVKNDGSLLQTWPSATYELDGELAVGAELRGDYSEAGLCLDAGCFKASLVMSRRALQRVLKAQGCEQRNLSGDDGAISYAVKNGILRKAFHPLAQEIKGYGNLGAHPDDEQLENASKETATQVLRFLEVIVDEFYRVPLVAEKLRRRRTTEAGERQSG